MKTVRCPQLRNNWAGPVVKSADGQQSNVKWAIQASSNVPHQASKCLCPLTRCVARIRDLTVHVSCAILLHAISSIWLKWDQGWAASCFYIWNTAPCLALPCQTFPVVLQYTTKEQINCHRRRGDQITWSSGVKILMDGIHVWCNNPVVALCPQGGARALVGQS